MERAVGRRGKSVYLVSLMTVRRVKILILILPSAWGCAQIRTYTHLAAEWYGRVPMSNGL